MDKKEAKMLFMRQRLDDPNVTEFEKQRIRQRLGVETVCSEADFLDKQGFELLRFVFNYLNDQETVIRRKKRTNAPFGFFSDLQRTIYYLSGYDSILEQDSLEQLHDIGDFEDIKGLILGFRTIGRFSDAELIESVINKRKISDREIERLLSHFRDDEQAVNEIETEIEKFIRANIKEILELQNLQ